MGKTKEVRAVRIRNRADCCGKELKNIKITTSLVTEPTVTVETDCAVFRGPGETNQQYDVECNPAMKKADIVLIQRVEDNTILQINELSLNPPKIGKK